MGLREQLQSALGPAYTLDHELTGGGMSRVFVATDVALGRPVVVKVISEELAAGVSTARFAREIRLAASLQQANIVPVLSAGESGELPYYTMPFVDGLSLRDRLTRVGTLSIGDVISTLRDVARALAYAHERGVVHRDIKPDNVLLSGDAAVVTDFGIAKAITAARTTAAAGTLTQAGISVGTPAYMAPEQATGDPDVDHRADIYSLGCVGYELLTGVPPFHGRPAHQLIVAHLSEKPPTVSAKRVDCPPSLARLVMQCLEKDPALRPQSAREILLTLESATTPAANQIPGRALPRRLIVTSLGVVGLVAALAVGAIALSRSRTSAVPLIRALAVLPFANGSSDPAQEYLADGMTDELATALGKLGMPIAARTLAYRYKGRRDIDPRDVGRALGVGYVVQGSVTRVANRLVVSAQLTSSSDDKELWQDRYTRDTKDVFAVQDTITKSITTALASRVGALGGALPAAALQRSTQGTSDADAYDLYLKAQFFLTSRKQLTQAVQVFQQAIEKDTTFARAYAGLAETLEYLPYFTGTPAPSVRDRVTQAATHALALDSSLSGAHVALGLMHEHAWEWSAANDEFRRAIAINPGDVSAHTQYARYLIYTGKPAEALDELRLAERLEPYSAVIFAWIAGCETLLGRHTEAITDANRALQIDSTAPAVQLAVLANIAIGNTAEAVRVARNQRVRIPPFAGDLAYALAKAGDRGAALRMAQAIEAQHPRPWFGEWVIAFEYLGAGDTTRALDALERSTRAHEMWPTYAPLCDHAFDPIRGSARFTAQLREVGLDDRSFTSVGCRRR
jgi:serine/threonine-protein kinase